MEMATKMGSGESMCDGGEEEFIEMDVSSCMVKLSNKSPSASCSYYHGREFEFQVSSKSSNKNESLPVITSSADELFYEGMLLPLRLSPRSSRAKSIGPRKISPSESHKMISREVNPSSYFINVSGKSSNETNSRNSLTSNKIKPSSLGLKFKAYVKGLFRNTSHSSSSVAEVRTIAGDKSFSTDNESPSLKSRVQSDQYQVTTYEGVKLSQRRRSFSGAIKRSVTHKSPTISVSIGVHECECLKRKDSELWETERSIQGAIAHCKQSQYQSLPDESETSSHGFHSRRRASEAGVFALSSSVFKEEESNNRTPI